MKLSSCAIDRTLASLEPLLSGDETTRLRAMADRGHARARAHAYVLLRELAATDSTIDYAHDGRPVLRGDAALLDVSISHTDSRVMVGVAPKPARLGVDVASLDMPIDAQAFLRHMVSARERHLLERIGSATLREAIIVMWSAKEAAAKCLGLEFVPQMLRVTEAGYRMLTIDMNGRTLRCHFRRERQWVETWALSSH